MTQNDNLRMWPQNFNMKFLVDSIKQTSIPAIITKIRSKHVGDIMKMHKDFFLDINISCKGDSQLQHTR